MNAGESATSQTTPLQSGLEVRSRLVLEEGLSRIDGHTRSRLNQARQAAVAAAAAPVAGISTWRVNAPWNRARNAGLAAAATAAWRA